MPAALMILLQVASPVPGTSMVDDFDLDQIPREGPSNLTIIDRCRNDDPAVIVVCGSRNPEEVYRLRPPPGDFDVAGPPKAEADLGEGLTGAIAVERAGMPNGEISKRIMIKVGTKF